MLIRHRLVVRGTVQGVGFRPWIFREATGRGLDGHVGNAGGDVVIEVQGRPDRVADFTEALRSSPPPLALVSGIDISEIPVRVGETGFIVRESEARVDAPVAVPADVATCAACLAEVADPRSRRHRYPFTNCADCGPRYTIIRSLPYDRSATTMAGFAMCADCRAEYEDPADRRFHAEPIACPACGPALMWEADGATEHAAAFDRAIACLLAGGIVAVKGVGGYHLAAVADDELAVQRLRERKARDEKPFAVMVATVEDAVALVDLTASALAEIVSPRRPIVIARRRPESRVADAVAPGSPDLGVLLPYSPLHHLLLDRVRRPLVMTSGNRTDEPIAQTREAARQELADIADGFLHHDRPIEVRCDDSIVRSRAARVQVVRRSRGFAPEPFTLPFSSAATVLAVGAELKSTVAIASGSSVVASHHLGDLEHPAAFIAFEQAIDHLCSLTGFKPEVIAHDLHPEYLSTKWALEKEQPSFGVQHHHAHVASCLVDNGRDEPVIGLALDGLGFGSDGTLWGGEVLLADLSTAQRLAHLRPVPLPGGVAAIREPWRMALVWASIAGGSEAAASLGAELDPQWHAVLSLAASPSTPMTSSAGRLFDAVAALAGGRRTITFEGQAAAELEAAARRWDGGDGYKWEGEGEWVGEVEGVPWVLDPSSLVRDVLASRLAGRSTAAIAQRFHRDLAAGLARAAVSLAQRERVQVVALSGGVFQNLVLTELVAQRIVAAGVEVLLHRHVPANDGGISIGQAAVACAAARVASS